MNESSRGVCLVVGTGIGVGGEIAKAFAADGYTVCMTRRARNLDQLEELADEIRAAGGQAHAFGIDARDEDEVIALFKTIEQDIGPLEVVVFNIGANVQFKVEETTAQVFRKVWEMATYAGFLAGREAARHMLPRGRGSIIFTGASSSVRGAAHLTAFTSAKFALRAVAESMAKELGPQGIHVGHVVIDGAMDGVFIRQMVPNHKELIADDRIMKPAEVAQNYVWLHNQPRSVWTFELDLRPWAQNWWAVGF